MIDRTGGIDASVKTVLETINPIYLFIQFLLQKLVYHVWVCLALARLHHLPYKKSEELFLP
jgi:hypothetical protein